MRRSILVALVILGIIPVAASADNKPAPVTSIGLVVTATQANGQAYPLQSGEITYILRLKIGKGWHHRWVENAAGGETKWVPTKARVGDTIRVCRSYAADNFGPNPPCPAYVFTKADARQPHIFRLHVTWTPMPAPSDILPPSP